MNFSDEKRFGIHFTPPELAKIMCHKTLELHNKKNDNIRIIDPSCGKGIFFQFFLDLLPQKVHKHIEFTGIEKDKDLLAYTESLLSKHKSLQYNLINNDFLKLAAKSTLEEKFFDIVISNPPYVRTQVLGSTKAQSLSQEYGIKGRIDLYHVFIIAMTKLIKPSGVIGFLSPNRYLTTKTGITIRQYLTENYKDIELIDLGDTKLFKASVLPSLFFGIKKDEFQDSNTPVHAKFTRIYRIDSFVNDVQQRKSIYNLLSYCDEGIYSIDNSFFKVSKGFFHTDNNNKFAWILINDREKDWVNLIYKNTKYTFKDYSKVKVGIKTTADSIFIRDDWYELDEDIIPEDKLLLPILSKRDMDRWKPDIKNKNHKIIYPHFNRDNQKQVIDIDLFPKAKAYFFKHKSNLENRLYFKKTKRKWWEIWVSHNPDQWSKPKLVFPDISSQPLFCYDPEGYLVNGNCYWITLHDETSTELLFLMMALANSTLMTTYHDLIFQNKLYSGRRRYLTQYVESYPSPNPESKTSIDIISLTKQLINHNQDNEEIKRIENEIDNLVYDAFNSYHLKP